MAKQTKKQHQFLTLVAEELGDVDCVTRKQVQDLISGIENPQRKARKRKAKAPKTIIAEVKAEVKAAGRTTGLVKPGVMRRKRLPNLTLEQKTKILELSLEVPEGVAIEFSAIAKKLGVGVDQVVRYWESTQSRDNAEPA